MPLTIEREDTSGAKARGLFCAFSARLKPCPFSSVAQRSFRVQCGLFALATICVLIARAQALPASHLVTGNGYGFAVVSPESGAVTKFYAHPYSFARPDPQNALSEGIETANFIESIRWSGDAAAAGSADYVEDSHVIRMQSSRGTLTVFMPFDFAHPALIVVGNAMKADAALDVRWSHAVGSEDEIKASDLAPGVLGTIIHFVGIEESLLLVSLDRTRSANKQGALAASRSWCLIPLEPGEDENPQPVLAALAHWRGGLSAQALAQREGKQLEKWRVKPAVHFASEQERHLWRQSEVMLRMAQSREPNRERRFGNGLIVAALPDGVFFTPWVRDMAWATVALARMGHRDEARAAVLAYFNARPTGKMRTETKEADYQISVVRYFGNGAEEPFFTQEGSTNIEFDDWGEALWVLGEYLKRFDDPELLRAETYRGTLYDSARDYIVKPLLANTSPYGDGIIVDADTSIWEERQKDKKHFAFSTAAAIFGLREFEDVARRAGDEKTRADVLRKIDDLQRGFDAAFIKSGHLHGTLEPGVKKDIDGALIPIINLGIVKDPAIIRDTVERMELLRVASGGYRRVRGTYTDPSIYEYWYEQEEFLFVDLSLAELYRRLGRTADADAMLARIVGKSAADHNIIPEMYVAVPCKLFPGKIGDPTGALPMVGYGAGAFVLHVLDREHSKEAGAKLTPAS